MKPKAVPLVAARNDRRERPAMSDLSLIVLVMAVPDFAWWDGSRRKRDRRQCPIHARTSLISRSSPSVRRESGAGIAREAV
jgi:hypothetical protein